ILSYLTSLLLFTRSGTHRDLHSFPTRRSSDLMGSRREARRAGQKLEARPIAAKMKMARVSVGGSRGLRPKSRELAALLPASFWRSEEHTSELQSRSDLVCRLLLEKKNTT